MPFVALSIAGSDPGGGAGIQADLKTFHRFDVYGTAVVTLVTVQNTVRLSRSVTLDAALVLEQIEAVLEDLPPRAIKTGALGSCAIVKAVAGVSYPGPLIVDPVTFSSTGSPLLDAEGQRAVRDLLLPRASLVTPNVPEAAQLSGIEIHTVDDMREAARRIAALGPAAVLVKGGHLESADAIDVLFSQGGFREYAGPRIQSRHTHGTGCTYSAAITALLARGIPLEDAVARAKAFITEAIRTAPGLGSGAGPLNHWA
jgi:hydroxymethylpyrimidine/phosphomethylpyrimidine kinase